MTYREFLETKIELATDSGFVVEPEKVNKVLKPHQRDAVMWALKGGRRALFESFGLGKTVQEIEFCHLAAEHENGRALIVLPLGVKQEFTHDAVTVLGYEKPEYCRTMKEVYQISRVQRIKRLSARIRKYVQVPEAWNMVICRGKIWIYWIADRTAPVCVELNCRGKFGSLEN